MIAVHDFFVVLTSPRKDETAIMSHAHYHEYTEWQFPDRQPPIGYDNHVWCHICGFCLPLSLLPSALARGAKDHRLCVRRVRHYWLIRLDASTWAVRDASRHGTYVYPTRWSTREEAEATMLIWDAAREAQLRRDAEDSYYPADPTTGQQHPSGD